MKHAIASYSYKNAQELFEALANFSRVERETMLSAKGIMFWEILESRLSDGSTVQDFRFREPTDEQLRREETCRYAGFQVRKPAPRGKSCPR